ncbi:chorismate-binding protein [Rubritalea spongiae]|uniref:Chorismate-binding protein n=1 Tax=Rubritalea spongiae TaxID=430797 RepID=A0ABW5E392_9BACT
MNFLNDDFALISTADGELLVGEGPFTEFSQCPRDGVAFYKNDFALSDSKPWKVPKQVHRLKADALQDFVSPNVCWQAPEAGGFARIFSEINETIQTGGLEKSVPVATECGVVESGLVRGLLGQLADHRKPFYSYAWVEGKNGFCGQTPELLFQLRKGRFKTMALAGTARASDRSVFAFDEKEIREHEYVAQTLVANLSDLGMVKRSERRIMDLGELVHFHTPLEIFMYGDQSIDFLLRKMHPTPALGPHPRTQETLEMLYRWRNELEAPAYFGAPFGVYDNGVFHAVVTIRGVYWSGNEIQVPSGCGVIEASRLTNEWRELELKRNAVKARFRI